MGQDIGGLLAQEWLIGRHRVCKNLKAHLGLRCAAALCHPAERTEEASPASWLLGRCTSPSCSLVAGASWGGPVAAFSLSE